jgi:site-specific DNA-methyltransferase (adenine-specific)
MKPWLSTARADIWHGNALDVYEQLEPGYELVICDGPYGMGKDRTWDPPNVAALPDLYRPHVEAWGRLCAPAASVYLWGTSAGWATLHPLMLEHGWTFRALVTWDKGLQALVGKDVQAARTWLDATEVAGFYQREPWDGTAGAGPATCVGHAAGRDERNWVREWLVAEWGETGLRQQDADAAMGTNGMAGHYFGRSQWELPTWERYQQLAAYAAEHGAPRENPYFVHPDAPALRSTWEHLRSEWEHLRAEYEDARAPFALPLGTTNVWRHPLVQGAERLQAADGSTLHPCQKPLAFYRRMIKASTRGGGRVLEPFGGTCRAAVATTQMGSRRATCIEMEAAYLDAVRPALTFVAPAGGLFG